MNDSIVRRSICPFLVIISLVLLIFAGCETPGSQKNFRDPEEFVKSELGFLQEGVVSREEILLRIGPPTGEFEDGRILTYQLVPYSDGNWHFSNPLKNPITGLRVWEEFTCSLVMVFREDGILERKSLVLPYGIQAKDD